MAALTPAWTRRRGAIAAAIGVVGAIATALGGVAEPARALTAYLVALAFAITTAVGGLVLLQAGHVIGARWMASVRRPLEAIAIAVTPLAALFVPLALGAAWVWPWVEPASLPADVRALVEAKRGYLDLPFFVARAGAYFAIWIAAAEVLWWRSRRRDRAPGATDADADADVALGPERALSAALLPAVGLAITFAAFDWLMSLQPAWSSTIFGVYVFAGGFVAGIALVIVVVARARGDRAVAAVVTPHHFHALGRLLLAFVVFWAYAAYFQLFLIALADKPIEVPFYLVRLAGGWRVVAWVLGVGHFALPFFLLLPRAPKLRPGFLATVAAGLLVMHYVDLYWTIVPALTPAFCPHWLDAAALAAVCGLTVAACAWRAGSPLVATGDPLLAEGARYRSPL